MQMGAAGAMQMWADGGMVVSRVIHLGYLSNWNKYTGHLEGKGGG
jgi:hypothetical protein